MKKWIAFVLIFVLTAGCFAGCNAGKDPLIGTWKGTLDLTEAIMAALDADDTVQITEFKVDMLLTFNADGTYSRKLDETSLDAAWDGLLADMETSIIRMLQNRLTETGMEISAEEVLERYDLTIEDLMQDLKAKIEENNLRESFAKSNAREGKFQAADGKLHCSKDLSTPVDPNFYENYTIEGNTLTLLECIGGDFTQEETDLLPFLYPMTFQKVKSLLLQLFLQPIFTIHKAGDDVAYYVVARCVYHGSRGID